MKKADAGILIEKFLKVNTGIAQIVLFFNYCFHLSPLSFAIQSKAGKLFSENFLTLNFDFQTQSSDIPVSGIIFNKGFNAVELKVVTAISTVIV